MLQLDWMKGSAKSAAQYFASADYFLENDIEAHWEGKYAEELGFHGKVTKEDLTSGLNNRAPIGGKITQRDSAERRTCLHAMFSMPKSATIMLELGGDTRIADAFRSSISDTLQFMQSLAYRRLRKDGQNGQVQTGNLIWATILHRLGRPVNGVPDPQGHGHVVILNATKDVNEGQWYALDGDFLKTYASLIQAFYRADFAKQLEQLGYKLDYANGDFEIHGISKELRDKFSGRTAQVEATKAEYGYTKADSIAQIARMNREKKTNAYSWGDLQQIWLSRLTGDELRTIRDTYLSTLKFRFAERPDRSAEYTEQALKELTSHRAWVDERKVITRAMQQGIGKVSYEGITNYLHSSGVVRRKRAEKEELTTKQAYARNVLIKDLWKQGMGSYEKLGRDTYTVKDPPHIRALKKLVSLRDKYMSVRGNIMRKAAMERAMRDLGAKAVKNVNRPPDSKVWFAESKMPDEDLLILMQKAEEQDARIVLWGDLKRSDLEDELKLEPVELFERKPQQQTPAKSLDDFLLLHIQRRNHERSNERSQERIQPEPQRNR